MNQDPSQTRSCKDLEIKSSTHLALVEIVAGSVGHGFKIPFTGTLLSYYQLYMGLIMTMRHKAPAIHFFNVSVVVALLKTLSPMGKKITPMIAIFMQGFLLWFGTFILGKGILGLALGSIFFVSWSIIQSALGFTIIYGFDFFRMIEFFQKEMSDYAQVNVYGVFFGYWVFKIIVAGGLMVYVLQAHTSGAAERMLSERKLWHWRARTISLSRMGESESLYFLRAVKDLINPFFFLSLILMVLFHFFQNTPVMDIVWFVCRSLGIAFVLFYLIRSPWLKRALFAGFGKNRRYRSFYKKVYLVQRRLNEKG